MATAKDRTLAMRPTAKKNRTHLLRFELNGRTVEVNVRTITFKENWLAKQEIVAAGYPPDDPHMLTARAALAVARRHDPLVSLDEILDALTLGDQIDYQSGVHVAEEDGDDPEA